MSFPTMPEALAHDWRQLHDLIDDTAKHQPIPCRTGDAALTAYRAYGIAHRKEAGVLGGLTETERRAEARKRKEAR